MSCCDWEEGPRIHMTDCPAYPGGTRPPANMRRTISRAVDAAFKKADIAGYSLHSMWVDYGPQEVADYIINQSPSLRKMLQAE